MDGLYRAKYIMNFKRYLCSWRWLIQGVCTCYMMNGIILEKIFSKGRIKTYVESLKMEEYDNSMEIVNAVGPVLTF